MKKGCMCHQNFKTTVGLSATEVMPQKNSRVQTVAGMSEDHTNPMKFIISKKSPLSEV
jgi:hypothetical protein